MDFVLSSSVETHAAAVVVTSPVALISEGDTVTVEATLIGDAKENTNTTANVAGTVIDGAYDPVMSLVGEANEGGDITLTGSATTAIGGTTVNMSMTGDTHTEGDTTISLSIVGTIFSAEPFYAKKLVVVEGNDNELTLESIIFQDGSTDIYGTVINADMNESVDFVSPLSVFAGAVLSNFDLPADVVVRDYNANVTLAAYSALLTVPFQQTNEVTVGEETTLSLLSSIENINFMLTTDIADSGSIRYEVADIDRNLQEGKLRIFPNEWTLSYINNPLDSSGSMNTVSSFIIPILEDKYGSDVFDKITLITARNPITGAMYNYVIQDGYRTPAGTINDFDLCYDIDGVFYPVPFMIKSITNDELEISWALGQET